MGSTHFISYLNVMRSLGSLVMLWTILFFCTAQAQAGQVNLAWTASASADGYRLYYGQASGNYTANVDVGNKTSHLLTGLQDGKTYYFAAKAYKGTYNSAQTTWSGFSNEVSALIGASTTTAPTASFTATPTFGPAPLAVTFNNTSAGNVTTWLWKFGDNTTSPAKTPAKSYAPGTYTVSLKATGPGGSHTATRTNYISVTPPAPTSNSGGGGSGGGGGGGSTVGLVGAYNFEEASGTTVADASGQNNKGTISGATRLTAGRFGKALFFDGVNDWVTVNDAASLDLTTGMTLEAWVYPTVDMTQWATVILKEQPGGDLYGLYANGNLYQPLTWVTIGGRPQNLSAGLWLLAKRWTHLAATYDGTTQRLYVDGVQVGQRSQTGLIPVSNSPLRLGGNSIYPDEYFQGRIDEVRIYNRALKAAEIQTDMKTLIAP